jgi:hypothetical protein
LARRFSTTKRGPALAISVCASASLRAPVAQAPLPTEDAVVVRITPTDKSNPPGKLADAEVHFTEGALEGLKLIGFAVWERRTGGGRNVTFPARQYSVNGERRTYALLRPVNGDATRQDRIRELVLQAYTEFEQGNETGAGSAP